MDPMILLTPDQLQTIVETAVRKVLDEKQRLTASPSGPLTIKEASAYLHLSLPTLYRYTSRRLIPHQKTGKLLCFNKEELDQWLGEHKKLTKKEILDGEVVFKNGKIKKG
jgi:excisionase family DNA binding protein